MRSAHRGQLDARVRRGQDDDPYHGHDRHDRHDRHDCHDLQQGGGADPRVPVPGTMSDKIARL